MLNLRIRFIIESKGIANPYTFLTKHGFTANMAHRYINGKVEHLKLSHLEKFCTILNCTPHDLLEWVPKEGNYSSSHPLAPLVRNEKVFNILGYINKLPLEQVKELQEFLVKQSLKKEEKD